MPSRPLLTHAHPLPSPHAPADRTSAQINKINVIPYDEIAKLVPHSNVQQNIREVSLNPNNPIVSASPRALSTELSPRDTLAWAALAALSAIPPASR